MYERMMVQGVRHNNINLLPRNAWEMEPRGCLFHPHFLVPFSFISFATTIRVSSTVSAVGIVCLRASHNMSYTRHASGAVSGRGRGRGRGRGGRDHGRGAAAGPKLPSTLMAEVDEAYGWSRLAG